jgi:hypothetical protein
MISSCPATQSAVIKAHTIVGPNLAGERGRTVQRPPDTVTINYVQIPRAILERFAIVMLAADIMFVNGVPFLISVAQGLNLITAKHLPSQTTKNLAAGIICVMSLYL